MDTLIRIALMLGLLAFAASCQRDDLVGLSTDAPRFTGVVTVAPAGLGSDGVGTVFWIETNPPGSGLHVGIVVGSNTVIVARQGRAFVRATTTDLGVGRDLRVWTDATEHLSTPPMYDATRIEIW